ncbi:MAG: hypothetical protein H8Z69_04760 [Nanohaloarchaea archaeon]|nr:hypothetical protein [Candidatus Nanohaloarchaea archaeon]
MNSNTDSKIETILEEDVPKLELDNPENLNEEARTDGGYGQMEAYRPMEERHLVAEAASSEDGGLNTTKVLVDSSAYTIETAEFDVDGKKHKTTAIKNDEGERLYERIEVNGKSPDSVEVYRSEKTEDLETVVESLDEPCVPEIKEKLGEGYIPDGGY